ncbi:hypothetical protein JB92DRAFT_803527 [Gautieria morchelliformis]|nr:hypothetical protein JB92DRAFT_803527 [Gautieria morchelliformis]
MEAQLAQASRPGLKADVVGPSTRTGEKAAKDAGEGMSYVKITWGSGPVRCVVQGSLPRHGRREERFPNAGLRRLVVAGDELRADVYSTNSERDVMGNDAVEFPSRLCEAMGYQVHGHGRKPWDSHTCRSFRGHLHQVKRPSPPIPLSHSGATGQAVTSSWSQQEQCFPVVSSVYSSIFLLQKLQLPFSYQFPSYVLHPPNFQLSIPSDIPIASQVPA